MFLWRSIDRFRASPRLKRNVASAAAESGRHCQHSCPLPWHTMEPSAIDLPFLSGLRCRLPECPIRKSNVASPKCNVKTPTCGGLTPPGALQVSRRVSEMSLPPPVVSIPSVEICTTAMLRQHRAHLENPVRIILSLVHSHARACALQCPMSRKRRGWTSHVITMLSTTRRTAQA